ncbi:MAG: hypothetical protein HY901_18130 [Deltaproteobacteria bacterium]|nr:hypothetical protein [Deltaproteobacteria bacterium]
MSLLPEDASYLEHVQAFFLAFRGDGVSLSPLDAELLASWQARGVPYPVICRGIRKAAETALYQGGQDARLRTLRSCRAAVEREYRRWEGAPIAPQGEGSKGTGPKDAQAGEAPEAPDAASFATKRLKKARSQLRKAIVEAGSPSAQQAIEAAARTVAMEVDDPRQVSMLIARADDAMALIYLRRLAPELRRELMRQARFHAGPRPVGSSRRARKDALRAHRVALARSHGQLPALA